MSGPRNLADRILESPVTWLITAINFGVFTIAWIHQGDYRESLNSETVHTYGGVWRYSVWGGEYWRLLTAVFLHIGWIHLLWNSWILFSWCREIERTVGSAWFAFAYATTGIGASAVSVIGHPVLGAGASGAGFGMFAVVLSILYRRAGSWQAFIASPSAKQILGNVVLILVIGFVMLSGFMDNYAHLGGFILGIPCGLVLEARRGKNRTSWMVWLAAYMLLWLGVVVVACIPGLGFGRPGG